MRCIQRMIHWLASPAILLWLMPWLMGLLILGTLAQRDIGLYRADQIFFSSWVVWMGIFPLPGTLLTLAALALCLLAKLVMGYCWRNFTAVKKSAGSIITHLSILVLLVGGLISGITRQEGFVALSPGEKAAQMDDYMLRELVVLAEGKVIHRISLDHIDTNQVLDLSGIHPRVPKLSLTILEKCQHCVLNTPSKDPSSATLQPRPLPKEYEARLTALKIAALVDDTTHHLLIAEAMLKPTPLIGDIQLQLRRTQYHLPFTVQLVSFTRPVYPGTDKAMDYESALELTENHLTRHQTLRMNEPVYVDGYVIYQSSFVDAPGLTQSVLAIVHMKGREIPYVATGLLLLGLILQLFQRARGRS